MKRTETVQHGIPPAGPTRSDTVGSSDPTETDVEEGDPARLVHVWDNAMVLDAETWLDQPWPLKSIFHTEFTKRKKGENQPQRHSSTSLLFNRRLFVSFRGFDIHQGAGQTSFAPRRRMIILEILFFLWNLASEQ